MPEGPEVESARVLVEQNLQGLKILEANVADDEKVFVNCNTALQSALEGRKLLAARRKGKYLWFLLDGKGPIPLLHFGMTGSIIVKGVGCAKYTRINHDMESWPPRFCKLELVFENGQRMAFVDGRRFGKVKLQKDPLTEEPVSKLGFDFISEMPSLRAFTDTLARFQRSGSSLRIKALLLDQAFAAGVGNWVADEVLYQARIHPEQPVADMEAPQIGALHAALTSIGQVSVAANADYTQFPEDWLFHYRWTGKQASSINGKKIDFITVGSRTSAYVPSLQKLVKGSGLSAQRAGRQAGKKPPGNKNTNAEGKEGVQGPTRGPGAKQKASIATAAADPGPAAQAQDGQQQEQQRQLPHSEPAGAKSCERGAPGSSPAAAVGNESSGEVASGAAAAGSASTKDGRGRSTRGRTPATGPADPAAAAAATAVAVANKEAGGGVGGRKRMAAEALGSPAAGTAAAAAKKGRKAAVSIAEKQDKATAGAAVAVASRTGKGARKRR